MAGLSGKYSIVGIGETALGKAEPGQTGLTTQARAAQMAMRDAGIKPGDIDGVSAHWGDKAASLAVIEYLGLSPSYTNSTLVGGQSSLTHLNHAAAAIEAGLCTTVLITYGSTQRLPR
jgi:3-oxoacyl-(acyl-carrier-protein) synthase